MNTSMFLSMFLSMFPSVSPRHLLSCCLALVLSLALAQPSHAEDLKALAQALASEDAAKRELAEKRLRARGFDAAQVLVLEQGGDADTKARRARLLRPYRPRLQWQQMLKDGTDKKVLGQLKGFGSLLGKRAITATQTAQRHVSGGLYIVTEAKGGLREFKGTVKAESLYDKNMQLVACRYSLKYTDSKRNDSRHIQELWLRKSWSPKEQVFEVMNLKTENSRTVKLPGGAVMADLLLVLGRGMNFKAKKLRSLTMEVINPDDAQAYSGTVKTVRREKVVAKGGARMKGLRLELEAPGLPQELGTPKMWLDQDQKPIKMRVAGLATVYAVTSFKAMNEVVKTRVKGMPKVSKKAAKKAEPKAEPKAGEPDPKPKKKKRIF